MDNLIQEILGLSREEVLEAAGFVGDLIAADEVIGDRERESLKTLTGQPFQNIQELEQLSRLLLLTAALNPEFEGSVRKAIEGTGQRNLILSGAEIVALSLVAVYALQVMLSKGRISSTEDIEFGEKDGQAYTKIHKKIEYGISAKLATILQNYFRVD